MWTWVSEHWWCFYRTALYWNSHLKLIFTLIFCCQNFRLNLISLSWDALSFRHATKKVRENNQFSSCTCFIKIHKVLFIFFHIHWVSWINPILLMHAANISYTTHNYEFFQHISRTRLIFRPHCDVIIYTIFLLIKSNKNE